MRNQTSGTRMSMTVLSSVVAGYLMLGLATQAAAECTSKSYKLTLPDQATLKLADGEHAIGSLQTEHGSLEARVTVKGKNISAPRFLIGGRPCETSRRRRSAESSRSV